MKPPLINMLVVLVIVILFCYAPLMAETYSWEDKNGTVNFTENYSSIPIKYLKKFKIIDTYDIPVSKEQTPNSSSLSNKPASSELKETGTIPSKGDDIYGGKKIDEWQKGLSGLQDEIKTLDVEIKKIESNLKQSRGKSDELVKSLVKSLDNAVIKYNEALARYNQLIESAKKQGVIIESQK